MQTNNIELRGALNMVLTRLEADPAIAADCYDIGAMYGDREGCEEALGRKLARAEATALEACIRHYLAHPA